MVIDQSHPLNATGPHPNFDWHSFPNSGNTQPMSNSMECLEVIFQTAAEEDPSCLCYSVFINTYRVVGLMVVRMERVAQGKAPAEFWDCGFCEDPKVAEEARKRMQELLSEIVCSKY